MKKYTFKTFKTENYVDIFKMCSEHFATLTKCNIFLGLLKVLE